MFYFLQPLERLLCNLNKLPAFPFLTPCHLQLIQGPLGVEKLIIAIKKNISYPYHRPYIQILHNTFPGINPYFSQVFYNGYCFGPCAAIPMHAEAIIAKGHL